MGWDEFVFILERHDVRHGVFEHYDDTKLGFVGTGYDYIHNLYQQFGVQYEDCNLLVEWLCGNDTWEQLPLLRLNFMKVVFTQGLDDGCVAEIDLDRDDCFSTFLNRFDTKVNITSLTSIDGSTLSEYDKLGADMVMPSQTIRKFTELRNTYFDYETDFENLTVPATTSNIVTVCSLPFGEEILNETGIVDTSPTFTFSSGNPFDDLPPLLIVDEAGSYDISLAINAGFYLGIEFGAANTHHFNMGIHFLISRQNGTTVYSNNLYQLDITQPSPGFPDRTTCDPPDSYSNQVYGVSMSGTFDLLAGDEIRIYAQLEFQDTAGAAILRCERVTMFPTLASQESFFKAKIDSTFEESTTKAFYINETFSRAIESITNDCFRAYSDYFGRTECQPYASDAVGCGSLLAVTNGTYLRELVTPKPLTLSVKDIFDFLNSLHCIGFCLEDDPNRPGMKLIRYEPAKYFYDQDDVLTLTGVRNAVVKPFDTRFINGFKIGFKNWQCEEYTGLDSTNTQRDYHTLLSVTENKLDVKTDAIGEGYATEVTRRQRNSSKDWRWDNHTFLICMTYDGMGAYAVEQGGVINETNLLFPDERINLRISPARNALRWLPLLAQNYKDVNGTILYFTDGDGNVLASWENPSTCANESGVIAENGNLSLDNVFDTSLAFPAFLFEKISFTTPFSANQWLTVRANPHKRISVSWGYQDMFSAKGFIYSLKYRPSDGQADIVLLPEYVSESCVFTFEFSPLYTDPLEASADTYLIDFRTDRIDFPLYLIEYVTSSFTVPIDDTVLGLSQLDGYMESNGWTVIETGLYAAVFALASPLLGINVSFVDENEVTNTVLVPATVVTEWIGTILFPLTINTWEINGVVETIDQVINSQAEFDAFMLSYGFEKVGLNYILTTNDKYGVMNITDNNSVDQDIVPDKDCETGIGRSMIGVDFEIKGDGIGSMEIEKDFRTD